MPSRYECFFLTPVDRAQESLRRWASNSHCRGGKRSYHNSRVVIGEIPWHEDDITGRGDLPSEEEKAALDWPMRCDGCDYEFVAEDQWQRSYSRLFRRSDNGELTTIEDAPVGAMWDAPWMKNVFGSGPDGLFLVVRTPGGDWMVDAPSRSDGKDGPGWTRKGQVPKVTVRPSIGMGDPSGGGGWAYHGFLTDGVLIACGDSPT